ncbi:AAA family ATPase [Novacetimonas hansenii]|uniref:AAA family ATPase n=1 Tax=Novacetimonas hansenii TaxID=436 RepID=UPI000789AB41|nr:AAA family ATPase [Novacetimonas hansenii]RFP01931.1 chromosome segregation protein SMC [Novacetimonas hansenii]WEQ59233.1 AAA family ATPase [Novacetimonas hansenii]CUW47227.1 Chromosome partition protein Smc [Novacetimonas hansenii]
MTARFARLRIAGFKSFADPASIEILPGLTGIVGPNGCGKSNVVEALRWTMGETSARSLRGGEMDDLIFAGTAARPARNTAEVTLSLEGTADVAPPPFQGQDELQVVRRAERGAGSGYRINGKSMRARDVQTLFADLASGARSSAMVSQGRVSALVNARPEERRSILEEAAGITGLHGRRHEAELKLRATEANLERAEDLRLQLEARLGDLQAQATQAARYRELSQGLRESEVTLLALLHARARNAVAQARENLHTTRHALLAAEQAAEDATIAQFEATQALPGLRTQADTQRSQLERHRVMAENIAAEVARANAAVAEAQARLEQCQQDHEAALARQGDARTMLERLEAERAEAQAALDALPGRQAQARDELATLQTQVREQAGALEQASVAAREAQLRFAQMEEARIAASERQAHLQARHDEITAEVTRLRTEMPGTEALAALDHVVEAATQAAHDARVELETATQLQSDCVLKANIARNEAAQTRRQHEQAAQELAQAAARLETLHRDHAALAQREVEARELLVAQDHLEQLRDSVTTAEAAFVAAREALERAEIVRTELTATEMEVRARVEQAASRRGALEQATRAARSACARAAAQLASLAEETARIEQNALPPGKLDGAIAARKAAEQAHASAEDDLRTAEQQIAQCRTHSETQARRLNELSATVTGMEAEADGLAKALAADGEVQDGDAPDIATLLHIPEGLETALAVVLSEGLEASVSSAAARQWRDLPVLEAPAFPDGNIRPLSGLINAPGALARVLAFAGLLDDGADGDSLQRQLAPGQCLVTRDGALWRWDGYRLAGNLPSRAALKLRQINRLRDIRAELDRLRAEVPERRQAADDARIALEAATTAMKETRVRRAGVEEQLGLLRRQEAELGRQDAAVRTRLDTIAVQLEAARAADAEARQTLETAQQEEAAEPAAALLQAELERASATALVARQDEGQARQARQAAQVAHDAAQRSLNEASNRHGEAETRLQAIMPALARMAQDLAQAQQDHERAQAYQASLPPAEQATATLDMAEQAAKAAAQRLSTAQDNRGATQAALDEATQARTEAGNRQHEIRSILDAQEPRLDDIRRELATVSENCARIVTEQAALPDPELLARDLEALRENHAATRGMEQEVRDLLGRIDNEHEALTQRIAGALAAMGEWRDRVEGTQRDVDATHDRLRIAHEDHGRIALQPEEITSRSEAISTDLSAAEGRYNQSAEALKTAETTLSTAQDAREKADAAMIRMREDVLRAEGKQEQAEAILAQLMAESQPPAGIVPTDLSEAAEAGLRRKVGRLARQREELGPVNLRAEIEANEAGEQINTIMTERTELESAIARLRGTIGNLNREGRERLMAVFSQIDQHFQSLFTRMFNGGRAHLGMVGNDDPLQAGLEIYAQPPGKKLATLSLLSGGEQALTALSLIFAVFRCNPAPICVLDEVDAPLDDANVGRFCALLGDMVAEAGTRFLVVTHHQLTMAHMDRLYGVTMQERGVSRVLSIDLERASAMVTQDRMHPTDATSP